MLQNVCQSVARFHLNVLGGIPWSRAVAVLVVAALVVVSGSAAPMAQAQTRGGGGDIIIFDVIDSVANSTVPQAARAGGGVVPDFVLVNGVSSSQVMLLGESGFADAYWVLVDMGDSIELRLIWANESSSQIVVFRLQMQF
ncbi:MAG: hypothetical protein IT423_07740 [Pirellulaceae bacterium]|nr:hypothetical protein [Pirellulaceae bacterium]